MHKLKMSNHISEAKFYFYNNKIYLFQKLFDCKSILISILSRKEIKKVDFIYDDEKKLVRKIQKCYNNAVYMRADYIRVNGKIQLMELELVDPDLMTRKLKSKKEKNEFIEKFANEILKGINNI